MGRSTKLPQSEQKSLMLGIFIRDYFRFLIISNSFNSVLIINQIKLIIKTFPQYQFIIDQFSAHRLTSNRKILINVRLIFYSWADTGQEIGWTYNQVSRQVAGLWCTGGYMGNTWGMDNIEDIFSKNINYNFNVFNNFWKNSMSSHLFLNLIFSKHTFILFYFQEPLSNLFTVKEMVHEFNFQLQ